MQYKFIKYKTKHGDKEFISDWCFEAQSLEDVLEFFNTYTKPVMNDGFGKAVQALSNNIHQYGGGDAIEKYEGTTEIASFFFKGHPKGEYENALNLLMRVGGRSFLQCNDKLYADILNSRIDCFFKGKKSGDRFFNPSDGLKTIVLDDRYSIVIEEIYKDTIAFPTEEKPTINDVRFIVWDGGKHWYAKIKSMDVVVNGEQKWNTKEEAEEAAKQFIKDNWK